MKNKVILFLLILFLVIVINNNCFALDNGSYQVDISSIDFSQSTDNVFVQFYNCVKEQLDYDFLNDTSLSNNVFFFSKRSNGNYWFNSCSSAYISSYSAFGNDYRVLMPGVQGTEIGAIEISSSLSTIDFSKGNVSAGTSIFYFGSEKPISNVSYDFTSKFNGFEQTGNVMYDLVNVPAGLNGFIWLLTSSLNVDSLFNVFGYCITLIVVAVLFVFGFNLFRKLLHRFK